MHASRLNGQQAEWYFGRFSLERVASAAVIGFEQAGHVGTVVAGAAGTESTACAGGCPVLFTPMFLATRPVPLQRRHGLPRTRPSPPHMPQTTRARSSGGVASATSATAPGSAGAGWSTSLLIRRTCPRIRS